MKVHLIGVGGTGMSALAEVMLDNGTSVTGSDRFTDSGINVSVINKLRAEGVEIFPQDGSGVNAGPAAVVASSAIESNNPDLIEAKRLNITVVRRATALATILSYKRIIAVAGTCGKSTTTAMLGHILDKAGFSPTVVNGAPVAEWTSDSRTGSVLHGFGEFCIIEVDESDKSLLEFNPFGAIITNSSADHFSQEETDQIFDRFKLQVSGPIIDGRIDHEPKPVITIDGWRSRFTFHGLPVMIPIAGKHNAINAWMAIRMACNLGVSPTVAIDAISTFHGVSRRMEYIGHTNNDALVFDDFAHNTEKIRAALSTVNFCSERTIALWRPHGYAPLRKMFDALVIMFKETMRPKDILFILPVFDAGGTADRTISSDTLVDKLRNTGIRVFGTPDISDAIQRISDTARAKDVVLVMGARDPELPVAAKCICR